VPQGRELRLMKALVQWFLPENAALVREALQQAGRMDVAKRLAVPKPPVKPPRKYRGSDH
jgi:hypothetical protein